jgi:hypothetical protein
VTRGCLFGGAVVTGRHSRCGFAPKPSKHKSNKQKEKTPKHSHHSSLVDRQCDLQLAVVLLAGVAQ